MKTLRIIALLALVLSCQAVPTPKPPRSFSDITLVG